MRRRIGSRVASIAAVLLLLPAGLSAQEPERGPGGATLRFGTMTFTASRDDHNELVLEAEHVVMPPGAETASMEGVHIVMSQPGGAKTAFEMTCDRGDLELESANFHAEGNVKGRTGDGRLIFTPRLDYDSDSGIVSTDAAVRIRDGRHTMNGRGFRYHVRDGRFVLKGGASVVEE